MSLFSQKESWTKSGETPEKLLENQVKKIPNMVFLGLAMASVVGSAIMTFGKKRQNLGNFIGLWAPTLLILGLYNKLVEVEGEVLSQS